MKTIKNQTFPLERDLYNQHNLELINCQFKGEEDGESALKECSDITLKSCLMDLRYPLWHDTNITLIEVEQTENCRASLWYSGNIKISDSILNGIKALRECKDIVINKTKVSSPEFGWKCNNIEINDCDITSQYIFFLTSNIKAKNSSFHGKYGFQYMENVEFDNCYFDTKDAFWHGKNITVKNSVVKGEYLGWYSENLTFINCKIIGIQPLCYCKKLKLIDCEMIDTNLAFEYSEVDATIRGHVDSIKNPLKGKIKADSIGEIILTEDSKYRSEADIECSKITINS